MGEQVVTLEHHANFLAKLGEILFGAGYLFAVNFEVLDVILGLAQEGNSLIT